MMRPSYQNHQPDSISANNTRQPPTATSLLAHRLIACVFSAHPGEFLDIVKKAARHFHLKQMPSTLNITFFYSENHSQNENKARSSAGGKNIFLKSLWINPAMHIRSRLRAFASPPMQAFRITFPISVKASCSSSPMESSNRSLHDLTNDIHRACFRKIKERHPKTGRQNADVRQ